MSEPTRNLEDEAVNEVEPALAEAGVSGTPSGPAGPPSVARALGMERYVFFVYLFAGVGLVWLFNKLIYTVWNEYAEPNDLLITLIAVVVGASLTRVVATRPQVQTFLREVILELSQVTWPGKKETYTATYVVLITTAVAAVLIGVFDAVWGFVTKLVYG